MAIGREIRKITRIWSFSRNIPIYKSNGADHSMDTDKIKRLNVKGPYININK